MIEAIVHGIINVLNPAMIPWVLFAVFIGLGVGILPGLGGAATMPFYCLSFMGWILPLRSPS